MNKNYEALVKYYEEETKKLINPKYDVIKDNIIAKLSKESVDHSILFFIDDLKSVNIFNLPAAQPGIRRSENRLAPLRER